jgi:hypothetical protein
MMSTSLQGKRVEKRSNLQFTQSDQVAAAMVRISPRARAGLRRLAASLVSAADEVIRAHSLTLFG